MALRESKLELKGIDMCHDILALGGTYLLSDGSLAHINRCIGLLGDDPNLLGREACTEQTTDLDFLFSEHIAIFRDEATVETSVQAVDDGIQIGPYQQTVRGDFATADAGNASQRAWFWLVGVPATSRMIPSCCNRIFLKKALSASSLTPCTSSSAEFCASFSILFKVFYAVFGLSQFAVTVL